MQFRQGHALQRTEVSHLGRAKVERRKLRPVQHPDIADGQALEAKRLEVRQFLHRAKIGDFRVAEVERLDRQARKRLEVADGGGAVVGQAERLEIFQAFQGREVRDLRSCEVQRFQRRHVLEWAEIAHRLRDIKVLERHPGQSAHAVRRHAEKINTFQRHALQGGQIHELGRAVQGKRLELRTLDAADIRHRAGQISRLEWHALQDIDILGITNEGDLLQFHPSQRAQVLDFGLPKVRAADLEHLQRSALDCADVFQGDVAPQAEFL